MNSQPSDPDAYRSFQLMTALEAGEATSQRELAGRLGIAVGLVNSYLKNFVAKGYVRVKSYPRNRYAYLLTPKGFAEKGRLAYQHLNYFTSLYTTTRYEYLHLFGRLKAEGVTEVIFCGVDEVAEIAYLSLQEVGLNLAGVIDDERQGGTFFSLPVAPLIFGLDDRKPVIITSLKRRRVLHAQLAGIGIDNGRVHFVGVTADPA